MWFDFDLVTNFLHRISEEMTYFIVLDNQNSSFEAVKGVGDYKR